MSKNNDLLNKIEFLKVKRNVIDNDIAKLEAKLEKVNKKDEGSNEDCLGFEINEKWDNMGIGAFD